MAITPRTNPNFEKVGSIRILSAANVTRAEQEGFIFGGLGYSANVDVNDGNGYSITINVVSKDGEYSISESDLNATSAGAKNIQIGNFVFYDFFLVSYSIQKQVENSILVLTYKDKSIFMDKLYIGLLHYEHGISLNIENNITKEVKPTSIVGFDESVKFNYVCDKSKPDSSAQEIKLQRNLNTVFTSTKSENYKTVIGKPIELLVNSPFFYSEYNYLINGVNGGFIILGSEEFKESLCALRDTSYTFRDLLSALFISNIPGIKDLSLPNNDIFKVLRKNYFGSLRSVLSNWASDIGIRFYFQPKIQYQVRDYSDLNAPPVQYTIEESLRYLDPNSGPESLKNLNTLLKSQSGKILKKVIQNINETASLEGTVKSSVITSIRREARTFPKSSESVFAKIATPLNLSVIPPLYGVSPISNEFLIRATLSKYDEELRDIYTLNNLGNIENIKAMGIVGIPIDLFADNKLSNKIDFLALFGEELGNNPSEALDNYKAFIVKYDSSKHEAIKNWERAVIEEFYNQFYKAESPVGQQQFCGTNSNYSIEYDTEPSAQRYSANELPFKNLLYSKSQLTLLDDTTNQYNANKTDPLFQVNNPFDDRNEKSFTDFIASIGSTYENKKSLRIINLFSNASARNALLMCANANQFTNAFDFLNQPNMYVIVCPNLSTSFGCSISYFPNGNNLSVLAASSFKPTSTPNNPNQCPPTNCEENIDNIGCKPPTDSSSSVYTGFIPVDDKFLAPAVRLTKTVGGSSLNYDLILPTSCNYQYAERRNVSSVQTIESKNYVLGSLPKFPTKNSFETSEYNVLNYSCVRNPVPEILTQFKSETGIQDQIVTFDDTEGQGKRAVVTNAIRFHDIASKQINNSIVEPFQTKSFSLTSTYIPKQLNDFIFNNPILSSMGFQLAQDGFTMSFNFQSRPKEIKSLDSIFQTQQFLKVL